MTDSIWLEIALRTTAPMADLAAERLAALGCQGAVLSETPAAAAPTEVVTLKGYWSPAWGDVAPVVAGLRDVLASAAEAGLAIGEGTITVQELPEETWAESWKQYFHPMRIGGHFIVAPSWEPADAGPDDHVIILDPGMAFGTGQHPTTQLCLAWLEDLVPGGTGSLLDLGTGSGILAIGGAMVGFDPIVACDIDPLAVSVSVENCQLNARPGIRLFTGGIADVTEAFDVIVANILAEVIIELAPQLPARIKPGGRLVASGIISRKADEVAAALTAVGLTVLERRDQGEWVALLARRPA